MENKRVFNVKSHYLVEIDSTKPFNNGTMSKTYSWEIFIAVKDTDYRGKAIESNKGITIPWTTLKEQNLLDEMIQICERSME